MSSLPPFWGRSAAGLPLPAYDSVLKCCHAFNLLDARGVISATERMAYILRVRTLAKAVCASYMEHVVGIKPAEEDEAAEDGASASKPKAGKEAGCE